VWSLFKNNLNNFSISKRIKIVPINYKTYNGTMYMHVSISNIGLSYAFNF